MLESTLQTEMLNHALRPRRYITRPAYAYAKLSSARLNVQGQKAQQHVTSPAPTNSPVTTSFTLLSNISVASYSDEGSISAAVPAGQGGRFPTDVWGDPPGGDERGFNRKNGRCRRKKKRDAGAGGAWGAVAMRRSSSGSIDSGSIVDRRLARYVGKDGGGQGDCCPPRGSLLPGRTAEIARFRQQQLQYYLQKQQPQQQDPQHQRLPIGGNGRISVTEHVPAAGAEVFSRRDDLPLETFNTTPHSGTHERYSDSINAPPALSNRERGGTPESPATPCGWAAGDPANVEEGPICDAAGRDSEWLAERRAADREAKEVLGALKHYNTRLCFLVGGY